MIGNYTEIIIKYVKRPKFCNAIHETRKIKISSQKYNVWFDPLVQINCYYMTCPVSREDQLIGYLSGQDSVILPARDYTLSLSRK